MDTQRETNVAKVISTLARLTIVSHSLCASALETTRIISSSALVPTTMMGELRVDLARMCCRTNKMRKLAHFTIQVNGI